MQCVRASKMAILLLLAGCGGGVPNVVIDTAAGPTPLYPPAPGIPGAPPPGLAMPPMGPNSPVPPPIVDRSGTYAGIAEPLNTGGGLCISNRKVSGFRVRGNSIRFGQYRGTIAPDNGVQMVAAQSWIYGQFEGPIFRGQLDLPGRGRFGAQGCTYMLTLERVGP